MLRRRWCARCRTHLLGFLTAALQISPKVTHHAATGLFFLFGVRTLYGAIFAWDGAGELEEVEAELKAKTKAKPGRPRAASPSPKAKPGRPRAASPSPKGKPGRPRAASPVAAAKGKPRGASPSPPPKGKAVAAAARPLLPAVLVEVFVMTFLAEWGDRSQIATIGLAASNNALGVTLGGCLGHAVCTTAAVVGGRGVASMISERVMALLGGTLFMAFGVHSLLTGPQFWA
jgi:putative Ca2+/H+ antiporter (TMEM165/GDT1 family)